MNRALLVSLLKKNIDELILLTEGFSEMSEYPAAIMHLAKNKTDDIRSYIDQLGNFRETLVPDANTISEETRETEVNTTENTEDNILTSKDIIASQEKQEEIIVEEVEEVIVIDDIDASDDISVEKKEEEEVVVVVDEKDNLIVDELIADTENETEEQETDKEIITIIELTEVPGSIFENSVSAPKEVNVEASEDTKTADKKITIAEKLASQTITRNELHAKNEANGINSTIGHKKIDDIRQAISLGDRFRFQRELFRNNGEEMNKMLNYINLLASYDEIVSFLQSKYNWPEDHPAANDFYQIIKRKF